MTDTRAAMAPEREAVEKWHATNYGPVDEVRGLMSKAFMQTAREAYIAGWQARAAMADSTERRALAVPAPELPSKLPSDRHEAWDDGWNAAIEECERALVRSGSGVQAPVGDDCGHCHSCAPITMENMRMILCVICGNKRCPHANDHRNACTGSNTPGQPGSAYPSTAASGSPHEAPEPDTPKPVDEVLAVLRELVRLHEHSAPTWAWNVVWAKARALAARRSDQRRVIRCSRASK